MTIDNRRVNFRPNDDEKFAFKERALLNHKMIISAIQAQRILSNECIGFLASTVDKRKYEKLYPTNILVVKEVVEVFLQELQGLLPEQKNFFRNRITT